MIDWVDVVPRWRRSHPVFQQSLLGSKRRKRPGLFSSSIFKSSRQIHFLMKGKALQNLYWKSLEWNCTSSGNLVIFVCSFTLSLFLFLFFYLIIPKPNPPPIGILIPIIELILSPLSETFPPPTPFPCFSQIEFDIEFNSLDHLSKA